MRIEDIDPPREVPGAADAILKALETLGLHWDGPILYQSHRSAHYEAILHRMAEGHLLYACRCSRRDLMAQSRRGPSGWIYPGTCRTKGYPAGPNTALRVVTHDRPIQFEDRLQGLCSQVVASEVGDFVVRRADGLIAYQLAVVIDDADQGITEVVRGCDLLDSTPRQIHLQQLLGFPTPRYLHLPVAVNRAGEKLSKQTGARPLDLKRPAVELARALAFLGHPVPGSLTAEAPGTLLDWAVRTWHAENVPPLRAIPVEGD